MMSALNEWLKNCLLDLENGFWQNETTDCKSYVRAERGKLFENASGDHVLSEFRRKTG